MTSTQQQFINEFAPIVQKYAVANGYHICVVPAMIAQACLESFYGTGLSSLARKYHNYWGMKAGTSSYKGKTVNMKTGEEYAPGVITTIRDNFRAYDTMEQGVQGYFEFLKYPRYAPCKNCTTPEEFAKVIKDCGWATSSTYTKNIISKVDSLGLKKYGSPVSAPQQQQITIKATNYIGVVTATALKVRSSYSETAPEQTVGTPPQTMLLKKNQAVIIQRESSNGWGELAVMTGYWVSLKYIKKA